MLIEVVELFLPRSFLVVRVHWNDVDNTIFTSLLDNPQPRLKERDLSPQLGAFPLKHEDVLPRRAEDRRFSLLGLWVHAINETRLCVGCVQREGQGSRCTEENAQDGDRVAQAGEAIRDVIAILAFDGIVVGRRFGAGRSGGSCCSSCGGIDV